MCVYAPPVGVERINHLGLLWETKEAKHSNTDIFECTRSPAAHERTTHNYFWVPTLLFLPEHNIWPPIPDAQCPMTALWQHAFVPSLYANRARRSARPEDEAPSDCLKLLKSGLYLALDIFCKQPEMRASSHLIDSSATLLARNSFSVLLYHALAFHRMQVFRSNLPAHQSGATQ